MEQIGKVLTHIFSIYSKLPITSFMHSALDITIIYPYEQVSFFKLHPIYLKLINNRQLVLLIIHSTLLLDLSSISMEDIILIDNTYNVAKNILQPKRKSSPTKAIIIPSKNKLRLKQAQFEQQLDVFLSLVELFHGYLNSTIYLFYNYQLQIRSLFNSNEQQYQNIIQQASYMRILQHRGNRITLQELQEVCDVNKYNWGESYTINQGADGVIIFITHLMFPLFTNLISLYFPNKFCYHQKLSLMGYYLFTPKSNKSSNTQGYFTIFIINFNQILSHQQQQVILISQLTLLEAHFQKQRKHKTKQINIAKSINFIERICQLLQISEVNSIMRNLFIKSNNDYKN